MLASHSCELRRTTKTTPTTRHALQGAKNPRNGASGRGFFVAGEIMSTTEDKKYNGWTNYETWNVKLWMDNDEGSYHHFTELAQDCYDAAEVEKSFTREERAALNLADALKDEFQEACPDLGASCWADLLSAALSEVNWYEIAEHLIEEVDKDEEIDAADPSEEEKEATGDDE